MKLTMEWGQHGQQQQNILVDDTARNTTVSNSHTNKENKSMAQAIRIIHLVK